MVSRANTAFHITTWLYTIGARRAYERNPGPSPTQLLSRRDEHSEVRPSDCRTNDVD